MTTTITGLPVSSSALISAFWSGGNWGVETPSPGFSFATDADDDRVHGQLSTLPLVVFGGQGDDVIDGGTGGDIIVGDRGRVLGSPAPASR